MPFSLTTTAAPAYLDARGICAGAVRELGGGVSNVVLLAETSRGPIVLKQALGRLRVEQEWLSDPARILREAGAIRALAPILPPGSVPEIVFEDPPNLIYAMGAAPASWPPWKELLMNGVVEPATAARAGALLGEMIRGTWGAPEFASAFGDQTVFDQLRIDPYYRSTAARHPPLAPRFQELIRQSAARRVSLVHGDWSPKNFLVGPDALMAIDWEVVHYGDPAFDAAFLLNHLLLKSFRRPEWSGLYGSAAMAFWKELWLRLPEEAEWFESAAIAHLGCLMLARVDGKSPAEYLSSEFLKAQVRDFAMRLITAPPWSVEDVWRRRNG